MKNKALPTKFREGFLRDFDKRTEAYVLLKSSYDEIVSDLGGLKGLSHVQLCLVERFIFLEFAVRNLELRIAKYPKKSEELLGKWIQAVNSISGLAKTIGLKRRAKKVPSLEAYVNGKKK